jgi:GTP-binding protein HflX
VFNKSDCYRPEAVPHQEQTVSISAKTGEGLDKLLEAIAAQLDDGNKAVTLHLPYDKGGLLDLLYREAKVDRVEYADTIEVDCVVTPRLLGQVRDYCYPPLPVEKEPWED